MKELKLINPENVSEEEVKSYRVREAARAVVFDDDDKIALLHVSKNNYYKLPGGGLESGEDKVVALRRECNEEIGCDIEVIKEIESNVVEYRRFCSLKQISYCYVAKIKGKKGRPNFTDYEKEKGFEAVWLSFEEAMKSLVESKASGIEGKAYIVPRDIFFVKEAKNNYV